MFGFPVAQRTDDFVLRQNLLKTAIFQVRFQPIAGIAARFEEIQSVLADVFPRAQERMHQEYALQLVDKTPIISPTGPSDTNALIVANENQQKIFAIKEDELTLTIGEADYINFAAIQETLDNSIYRIVSLLNIDEFLRVSIRKINILAFPINANFPIELLYKTVYQNLLTLSATAIPASRYLFSGVSNYRFVNSPFRLDLVYGITPDPGPDDTRELVLDIDLLKIGATHVTNVRQIFNEINSEVFNVFKWSINSQLIELLNREHEAIPTQNTSA